jgi:aromatic ring-opening dioxygenase catalytic subunit (LigB family)
MPDTLRQPAIYVTHGGGPWPFIDLGPERTAAFAPMAEYLRRLVSSLPTRPTAILMVSAHWEAPVATVMTAERPPMLYDYYGFPPESYRLQWPAATATALVPRALALMREAGVTAGTDPIRGFDHGTFVPMMLAVPDADIPVLQVSLLESLDPVAHYALGRALAPLRDEGVLFIGSGSSYHNMRGFGRASSTTPSRVFDAWLVETAATRGSERERRLAGWVHAPAARECHPREEHLLPLHVMAGAAHDEPGTVPFSFEAMAVRQTAIQFG